MGVIVSRHVGTKNVTKGIIHRREEIDFMPCNIDLSGVDGSISKKM